MSHEVAFFILHSAFCIRPEVALGGFDRPFCLLHSAFCIPCVVALGGFVRVFEVRSWMLGVGCSAFTIRILNTNPLSRLTRGWSGGTMVLPWYRPIPIENCQRPVFDQPSLSKARKPLPEPAAERQKKQKGWELGLLLRFLRLFAANPFTSRGL